MITGQLTSTLLFIFLSSGKKAPNKPLQEVELTEPIRYNPGDPIESWLTSLMCLDSHTAFRLTHGLPPPKDCELFYVDRDALFSYHKVSLSDVVAVCACGYIGFAVLTAGARVYTRVRPCVCGHACAAMRVCV